MFTFLFHSCGFTYEGFSQITSMTFVFLILQYSVLHFLTWNSRNYPFLKKLIRQGIGRKVSSDLFGNAVVWFSNKLKQTKMD